MVRDCRNDIVKPMNLKKHLSLVLCLLVVCIKLQCVGSDEAQPSQDRKARRGTLDKYSGLVYYIGDSEYKNGTIIQLEVAGRDGYSIRPNGPVDRERRFVWIAPWSLGIRDPKQGRVPHEFYVESLLAKGFHVAGVDVGISCGSLPAVHIQEKFYDLLTTQYGLNRRARLFGQSNGGLICYSWAWRHPQAVDRIFGIYPSTDLRSWPGLEKVVGPASYPETTAPELAYGMSLEQLEARLCEFNPIDNLKPLAAAGVKIFHLHGDKDGGVPIGPNSETLVRRYRSLGGEAVVEVVSGRGHGPSGGAEFSDEIFYNSRQAVEFLVE